MNTIARELRIIKRYMVLSFKNYIQFPIDFVMNFIMVFFDVFSIILFWWSLSNLNVSLEGWESEELLVFVGMSVFSEGVSKILFGFRDLEYFILDGSFDKFLIRPLNPIKTLLFEKLNIFTIFFKILISIGILSVASITETLKLKNVFLAMVILILSTIAYELLYGTFSLLAFWFGRIYHARNLVFSFKTIRKYPINIFPKVMENIFTLIIPIALIATIPSNILLDKIKFPWIYLILSIGVLFSSYIIFNYVLKKALMRYGSTGS